MVPVTTNQKKSAPSLCCTSISLRPGRYGRSTGGIEVCVEIPRAQRHHVVLARRRRGAGAGAHPGAAGERRKVHGDGGARRDSRRRSPTTLAVHHDGPELNMAKSKSAGFLGG